MKNKDVIEADRVLVVDANRDVRENVYEALVESGYSVEPVTGGKQLLERAATDSWSVLLIDADLPDMDMTEILIRLQEFCPETAVVVMSGCPTLDTAVRAMRHGACDLLAKPFDLQELVAAVQRGVRRHERYAVSIAGRDSGQATTSPVAGQGPAR